MPTELTMLAASAVLTFILAFPSAFCLMFTKGIPFAAGNRDEPYELPAWAERSSRAHRNMLENFPVFLALVLVVELGGATNETTALGATLFLWGRVAHAILYIAGVAWVRTAAYFVSVAGLLMIASEIF